MHDIQRMIKDHARVNKIEDTILHIEIKDITYSYEDKKPQLEDKGV